MIGEVVTKKNQSDEFIDSVASIQAAVKQEVDVEVKQWEVAAVMKLDLKMGYRRIKQVSM